MAANAEILWVCGLYWKRVIRHLSILPSGVMYINYDKGIRLTITIRNTIYFWRTTEWCNAALIELSPRFAAVLNEFRL